MSEWFDTFSAPKPAPDPYDAAAAEPGSTEPEAELDPREAAALLARTARDAERELDRRPPYLMLLASLVVLVAYGVLWLSVRNQHPYTGPAGWALGVTYGTIAVWVVVVLIVRNRALTGVSGRSMRQGHWEGLAFAVIWTFVYVFEGALTHAGASWEITRGIFPAAAPIVVVGSAAAANQAARQNWSWTGFALGAVVLAGGASYSGPRAVWGIIGVGLCVLLVVRAAQAWWLQRG
ncbi:MAG TPA: hypothetical protein VFB25_11710 [Gaiellaceae bacterium]|nr:hypothetical protein [Gaiellaceae bacterium]